MIAKVVELFVESLKLEKLYMEGIAPFANVFYLCVDVAYKFLNFY